MPERSFWEGLFLITALCGIPTIPKAFKYFFRRRIVPILLFFWISGDVWLKILICRILSFKIFQKERDFRHKKSRNTLIL